MKRGNPTVYVTPGSNDNGVDVVAINGDQGVLIQTKTSANSERALNWEAVKDVVTGEAFYRRRHPGVEFSKIGVTNQSFNSQAHENALLNGVELIDQERLAKLLDEYTVTLLEVDRLLYAHWNAESEEARD